MRVLIIILGLIFSGGLEAKSRTIQSTYNGFTKSCVAFSYFDKKKHLREFLTEVEKYAEGTPDYEWNKRLEEKSDEIAQLKLFSPYAFFKPRRSVSAYLDCNKVFEGFMADETKKGGIKKLERWKSCIQKLTDGDSPENRIANQVVDCMKN